MSYKIYVEMGSTILQRDADFNDDSTAAIFPVHPSVKTYAVSISYDFPAKCNR